jgi:hypothetical protein
MVRPGKLPVENGAVLELDKLSMLLSLGILLVSYRTTSVQTC